MSFLQQNPRSQSGMWIVGFLEDILGSDALKGSLGLSVAHGLLPKLQLTP